MCEIGILFNLCCINYYFCSFAKNLKIFYIVNIFKKYKLVNLKAYCKENTLITVVECTRCKRNSF